MPKAIDINELNPNILERGKAFFSSVKEEKLSLFNKARWTGEVMEWCMKNEEFKVQLLRFVDVFPYLNDGEQLTSHIQEYFGKDGDVPAVLRLGAKGAGLMNAIGMGAIGGAVLNKAIRYNIEDMAKQFIIGQKTDEAVKSLTKLRQDGFAFIVDVLGEATVSQEEAEHHIQIYMELIDDLAKEEKKWKPLTAQGLSAEKSELDFGHSPKVHITVKPTSFYSQTKPVDFENSVQGILAGMERVYEKVVANGFCMAIDMESTKYKDITIEVFKRLREHPKFRRYPHLGIVLQAYLRDTEKDIDALVTWSRKENLPFSIRLVKGAYWDFETVSAKQNGWSVPVWTLKSETDANYEKLALKILENSDLIYFGCASHNIRTLCAVMEFAEKMGVPRNRYEFQVLYGMAEPVRKGLLKLAGNVRLYCPYGNMISGMAYLVRRLLENTANASFLRQSFADGVDIHQLLQDPAKQAAQERALLNQRTQKKSTDLSPFQNEPPIDFTLKSEREVFAQAIQKVRQKLGKKYPLYIDGKEVMTEDFIPSLNPADPDEVIGHIAQAGVKEVDQAITAAKKAFPIWRTTAPEKRAEYLMKAAAIARRRSRELSAWQVLEVGKQWDQADADVGEAIDFLEYYARQMISLGKPQRHGNLPGEVNLHMYEPKGIAAVIAPWNFPLAIACGMCAAAIVAGNPVVFKPSGVSSIIGYNLVEIFKEAGLPNGVFNYVPGRGSVIGDHLIDHPDISLIAFTGSMEIGLRILERAGKTYWEKGQKNVKKVISEMGGKNAIIVDDDADLDEVIPGVLYSAFGFQGQKCSACSRVIVLEGIYDKFIARIKEAASMLKIGRSEDPTYFMGPVVDAAAQKNVLKYQEIARQEGHIVYESPVPAKGFYAPMMIVDGITPSHRVAQEEVFGPLLAVMKAKDFDQALEWANSTKFALTGAIYSRQPSHLERAKKEFIVGNLYLNRGSTGAMVGRQAFGGAKMSGVGTKAGGPDYLLHFMDPRTITENTMRRGFTPLREDDDFVI